MWGRLSFSFALWPAFHFRQWSERVLFWRLRMVVGMNRCTLNAFWFLIVFFANAKRALISWTLPCRNTSSLTVLVAHGFATRKQAKRKSRNEPNCFRRCLLLFSCKISVGWIWYSHITRTWLRMVATLPLLLLGWCRSISWTLRECAQLLLTWCLPLY